MNIRFECKTKEEFVKAVKVMDCWSMGELLDYFDTFIVSSAQDGYKLEDDSDVLVPYKAIDLYCGTTVTIEMKGEDDEDDA